MNIANYFNFENASSIRCYDFIDPQKKLIDQIDILREDMGWVEYNRGEYVIDYGWKPEFDINGEFVVYLIKDGNWDFPINELRSREIDSFFRSIQFCIDYVKAHL